ncbi:MAG TPA: bifunctional 5,10-methylenetetrahydrofolate dehydrogenase/5,10-methenyltetrahydrofolate cyclohydrolase [Thermoanaerobaculia bacterium]|nr:bifunctional 5,10-methylenetetrahydrofolate dehydrogenase/5,10-methenyltetrahydrofolate cyclohydrolase [Thermoanaerobaculia bacterium]
MAKTLDGGALAKKLRDGARAEVKAFAAGGRPPSLRVILLGNDPASETYVASKEKAAREAGLAAATVRLPSGTTPQALLSEIERANRDPSVDGLLVQMPLPPGHDSQRVFDALDPLKDVDGFHPENVGLLHQGRPRFVPCTPAGVLALLDEHAIGLSGRRAVVLGRSEIVGKPMAALLTARDATVTLCHSKSPNLPSICREADVLIVAIGRPGFVTSEFVRPGAAVVDVGMNRLTALETTPAHLRSSERIRAALAARGRALVGDVDYDAVAPIAGWITPVPGGVGPLTVAMLLRNTVQAARLRRG